MTVAACTAWQSRIPCLSTKVLRHKLLCRKGIPFLELGSSVSPRKSFRSLAADFSGGFSSIDRLSSGFARRDWSGSGIEGAGSGEFWMGFSSVSQVPGTTSATTIDLQTGHVKGEGSNFSTSNESIEYPRENSTFKSCKVAVIGAGAAGLVAARELIREGHIVAVFEQSDSVGGVWVYDPDVENDLLGVDSNRNRVHSSVYPSLRTNLPREIMGYTDFPFLPKDGRDARRFPSHEEVALYLKDFAEFYGLQDHIEFGVVVEYAGLVKEGAEKFWKVKTRRRDERTTVNEEVFDAVVVCSGHYTEPKIAPIPESEQSTSAGADEVSGEWWQLVIAMHDVGDGLKLCINDWPGKQMHSHNYREPHPFTNQIVVVIGNGASGQDISKEIGQLAQEVHIAGRTWSSSVDFSKPIGVRSNIWCHSMVDCACEDGTVKFKDGGKVVADVILHCTGYVYSFSFLDTKGVVSVGNDDVGPLYKHVFSPSLAPFLSFVGLPRKAVPFQLCELQSRWIAMTLSGKVVLPPESAMVQAVEAFYAELEASGKSKYFAQILAFSQYQYKDWLADQTGSEHVENWRKDIDIATLKNKRDNNETYRDVWPDEELHQEAYASLKRMNLTRFVSSK